MNSEVGMRRSKLFDLEFQSSDFGLLAHSEQDPPLPCALQLLPDTLNLSPLPPRLVFSIQKPVSLFRSIQPFIYGLVAFINIQELTVQFIVDFSVFRVWRVSIGNLNTIRNIIEAEIAQ